MAKFKDYIVVDESYVKDGKKRCFLGDFDTIEEARAFIMQHDEESRDNLAIIDKHYQTVK